MYKLRDVLTLGSVPPPPAETSVASVNVLDTKPQPENAPPRLCVVNLLESSHNRPTSEVFATISEKPSTEEPSLKKAANTNGTSRFSHLASGSLKGYVRGSTGANSSISKSTSNRDSKEILKRRKPKASLLKSNSSMIARANPHEALSKRLQDHKPEGYFAFINNSRSYMWMDLSSSSKVIKTLTQLHHVANKCIVGSATHEDYVCAGTSTLSRCKRLN